MAEKTLYSSIFNYITSQETAFNSANGIQLPGNWNWSMKEHLKLSYLYNNSQLATGKDDFKPVKNIIRPILNLQHRAEDIDVKDVQIYVDDADKYHLSFLVKKYHDDVFVVENDMDTFFDELNVSRIDYGGGLSKQLDKPRPEVVPLHSIAFCDQTDMLSGPIGLKHFFSPDQLLAMADNGWGSTANGATATLEQVITLSQERKKETQSTSESNTPGKYVEVYEVHGNFPNRFIDPTDTSEKFSSQIHIVTFYQLQDGNKGHITIYHAFEKESPFKLVKRDPVYGRALGFGGAEELFDDQVWTNYDMIRMQDMLDAAAKTIMVTQDKTLVARHPRGLKDMENMEFIDEAPNGNTRQLDTFPRNIRLFEESIANWEEHAKNIGASQDPLQGAEPTAGTPFASLQAQIQQGMGLHEYRRGQFAKHIGEIYKDWIIPHIVKEITKGTKFLSELSMDELQTVADSVATLEQNKFIKEKILTNKPITQQQIDAYRQFVQQEFMKSNKKFIEILKGEFKDLSLKVKVNVAGKQKDLSRMTDKLTNVFREVIANPRMLQVPSVAKLFNQILESSGLEQMDFSQDMSHLPPAVIPRETISFADVNAADPQAGQTWLQNLGLSNGQPSGQAPAQPSPPTK